MITKVIFEGEDESTKNNVLYYTAFAQTFYKELTKQDFNPTKVNMEHDFKNNKIVYTFEAEGSFPNLSLDKLLLMNPFLPVPNLLHIKTIKEGD